MASPHPEPKHVKELRGTLRADRTPNNMIEWDSMDSIPDCPKWIIDTIDKRGNLASEVKDYWNDIVMDTYKLGLLSKIGLPQIEDYVFNYRLYREHAALVAKKKKGFETYKNGLIGFTGAYKVMRDVRKAMSEFESLWGLNPSAMMKIDLPEKGGKKKDPFLG